MCRKKLDYYTRRCIECCKLYKTKHKYSKLCNDCKLPCGGYRGEWQKGKASSLLRMKALGVL